MIQGDPPPTVSVFCEYFLHNSSDKREVADGYPRQSAIAAHCDDEHRAWPWDMPCFAPACQKKKSMKADPRDLNLDSAAASE